MKAIADTGFVVGLAIASDQWHKQCLAAYQKYQQEILLPQTVLAEVAYLLT